MIVFRAPHQVTKLVAIIIFFAFDSTESGSGPGNTESLIDRLICEGLFGFLGILWPDLIYRWM